MSTLERSPGRATAPHPLNRDRIEPPDGLTHPDRGIVALLAAGIAALFYSRVAPLTTDSDSYLDVAHNLLEGRGLVMRVVDSWRPAVPDPMGLWPPLYPATIALAGLARLPLEVAARGISVVSFIVFAVALHDLARRARLGRGGALAVTALALATTGVTVASVMAWSEMMYLALATTGLAATLALDDERRAGALPALFAGLALGLAATTRYVGLLVIPLGVFALRSRHPSRAASIAWWIAAAVPPAAWLLHNQLVFGSAGGPPGAAPDRGAIEIARATLSGLRWGLLPDLLAAKAPISYALLFAIVLGTLAALRLSLAARLAAGMALIHVAGVAILRGSYMGERFLTPGYPFLWLAAGATLADSTRWRGRAASALAGVLVAVLLVATALDLRHAATATAASAEARATRARELEELRRLVPAGSTPVITDEGHRLRHATGRSTIELPGPRFRVREFDARDEQRWRAAGADLAVFRRSALDPPAGSPTTAEILGTHLASRIGDWDRVDSTDAFVLFRLR